MSNDNKTSCHPKSDAPCDSCEEMFQENIHHLVDEARKPRGAEHDARQKELNSAFGQTNASAQANRENHPLGTLPNAKTE